MLTLQIGQCGNQLGHALFSKLAQDENDIAKTVKGDTLDESCFFRTGVRSERRIARTLLIDMEPKVVEQYVAKRYRCNSGPAWEYAQSNAFTQQSGSGNNWAHGYLIYGQFTGSKIMDLLQSELEHCDLLQGFMSLQSCAGGTGSGLGSYLAEKIADEFPKSNILNVAVWPFTSGEVIVQNYNALLTMGALQQVSDGIIVLENDNASDICRRLLSIPQPSLADMNGVLASHLSSVLLPVDTEGSYGTYRIAKLFELLTPHPGLKLLSIQMAPYIAENCKTFSSYSWQAILKSLNQVLQFKIFVDNL